VRQAARQGGRHGRSGTEDCPRNGRPA